MLEFVKHSIKHLDLFKNILSLCQNLSNTWTFHKDVIFMLEFVKHLDLFPILHALMCPYQTLEQGSLIDWAFKQITIDLSKHFVFC
jgi:hypothetical protein